MKKNMNLFFWVVTFIYVALIFSGCQTEASSDVVLETTKFVAKDLEALKELLNEEGVTTVDYRGDLIIGDATLVIPDGKTVNVQDGGVIIGDGSLSVKGSGTLILPAGRNITVSGSKGVVIGKGLANYVTNTARVLTLAASVTEAFSGDEDSAAVESVSAADLSKVPADKTLYVLGDLTLGSSTTELQGTVKALGNVVLNTNSNIADEKLDFSDATLKSPAAVTVTANDNGTTVGAIEAGAGFTLGSGALTVNGAANFTGEATFNGDVKFNGDVNFDGAATLKADSNLAAGKTITVAKAANLTVDEGSLTVDGTVTVSEAANLDVKATLTVNGTIKVESGGTILDPAYAALSNINKSSSVTGPVFDVIPNTGIIFGQAGKIELETGAVYAYTNGTRLIGPSDATYVWGGSGANVTLRSGSETELTGGRLNVTQSTSIAQGAKTVIAEDAELVVNDGFTLTVYGTLYVYGAVSGTVSTGDGGEIVRPETITWTAKADGAEDEATSTKITFIFSKPVTELSAAAITVSSGTGSAVAGQPTGSGATWTLPLTGVTQGIVSVSVNGNNIAEGSKSVAVYKRDETAPDEADGLTATPGDRKVSLAWTDPTDDDFDHVEITWAAGTAPVSVPAGTEAKVITGLNNDIEYTFKVSTVDNIGNRSDGKTVKATPIDNEPPGEVTTLIGNAGNEYVTLTWTNPEDVDFDHVVVTWAPEGAGKPKISLGNGTGTITVSELTNNVEYTLTVKTVDKAGQKSEGKTEKLTPLSDPMGIVKVNFTGLPKDQEISLSELESNLSWAANTTLKVSVTEVFDNYRWELDGEALTGETGNSLDLESGKLGAKRHTLTVFVTKDGVEYAKTVNFTVEK
ncbi:MAG: fibronectin type III domain-containing protein [Spirochaetaceae bacterium]|jgi:hypothetical protein|nr:fibronectin type III domain-containing protein [Spirochaetaceae bacterium]